MDNFKIIINSYNRPQMLEALINEVKNYDYDVIDDGSVYDLSFIPSDRLTQLVHGGKKRYWLTYTVGINTFLNSEKDYCLFLPDDITKVDFKAIEQVINQMQSTHYTINLINDSRKHCWTKPQPSREKYDNLINKGFFDCGGITNRETLKKIKLKPMPKTWWVEGRSSGVGYQMTRQLKQHNVTMWTPKKSLAYHGSHESVMHRNERIKNPLISL